MSLFTLHWRPLVLPEAYNCSRIHFLQITCMTLFCSKFKECILWMRGLHKLEPVDSNTVSVFRLCKKDPRQLFIRLVSQAQEFVVEVKVRSIAFLMDRSEDNLAEIFLTGSKNESSPTGLLVFIDYYKYSVVYFVHRPFRRL